MFSVCGDMRIFDVTFSAPPVEIRDWAITHMGLGELKFKGKGQRVGVLDTGVDEFHQDLRGQVTPANFITGNKETPRHRDSVGHGTFCVGEIVAREDALGIVGAAPFATAFCGRVLYGNSKDASRRSIESDIAAAIKASVSDGCGVISMSLGGPAKSGVLEEAINQAVDAGVLIFAAAGNDRLSGSIYPSYPASYENVISVAAANQDDMPAWFSSYGRLKNKPEIAVAMREYVWGCLPGESTYGKMIGTSQATPLAAAVGLLWREAMTDAASRKVISMPTGKDVLLSFRRWLLKVVDDTNKNGWDQELGWGVVTLTDADLIL